MKDVAVLIYIIFSGLIFYLYIYSFLFYEGYFAFLNPLKPIKLLDSFGRSVLSGFCNLYGSIFPQWRLFIEMSNEQFYDLVVECEFHNGEKKIWIGTEDLGFGSLNLKNKFFILSLVSHYNSDKNYLNKLIVKSVTDYAEKHEKIINQIIINYLPFSLKEFRNERASLRTGKKEPNKLISKQFIWQNKKSPLFSKKVNYDLY
jgi:hypothetical protein